MSTVLFPFFNGLPTVLVTFAARKSARLAARRLLVDSGFTGRSAFVLSKDDASKLRRRSAPESRVAGALVGEHRRIWVRCSVPDLSFTADLMAIASDLESLNLPPGINGLAGLAFLSQFEQWGAERVSLTEWTFCLRTES